MDRSIIAGQGQLCPVLFFWRGKLGKDGRQVEEQVHPGNQGDENTSIRMDLVDATDQVILAMIVKIRILPGGL
jgi:hypothetical protein